MLLQKFHVQFYCSTTIFKLPSFVEEFAVKLPFFQSIRRLLFHIFEEYETEMIPRLLKCKALQKEITIVKRGVIFPVRRLSYFDR